MDILYTFKSFFQEIFSNIKNKSVFSVTLVTEKQFLFFDTHVDEACGQWTQKTPVC